MYYRAMIVFIACEAQSLLEGIAGILGASNRFLGGTFGLCLRVASHFADDLFDSALHLTCRTSTRSLSVSALQNLPIINTRFCVLVASSRYRRNRPSGHLVRKSASRLSSDPILCGPDSQLRGRQRS
jgi:hypothetical protein